MPISDKIIAAALYGPEAKNVDLDEPDSTTSHGFNVKAVSYHVYQNAVTVFGQLTHCLSFRADDQIWYTFKKSGNRITPANPGRMVVEKQEGWLIKTIVKLKPIGVAIGAWFGFDDIRCFNMADDHENEPRFVDLESGWEKAAGNFLNELAQHVIAPRPTLLSGLKLFERDNLKGQSLPVAVGINITRGKRLGWYDKASSLVASIPEGKKLELYQHEHFRGLLMELGPGYHLIRDLKVHNLGDEITSIRWVNA